MSNLSSNAVRRLPRYLRQLDILREQGVESISSGELGRLMGLTASQIRQDLSNLGTFGHQGFGYDVAHLADELAGILGTQNNYSAVLIGAGRLGRTLLLNLPYVTQGYTFLGVFDNDPNTVGEKIGGYAVMDVADAPGFIRANKVDIAILTVPMTAAQELTDMLVSTGIRGIWNFTNTELDVGSADVSVENVHFADSLLVLTYQLALKDHVKT